MQGWEAVIAVELRLALVGDLLQGQNLWRVTLIRPQEEGLVEAVRPGFHFTVLFLKYGQSFNDPINDGLRARGASRHIHIHRDHTVHAARNVVALAEDAAAGSAD